MKKIQQLINGCDEVPGLHLPAVRRSMLLFTLLFVGFKTINAAASTKVVLARNGQAEVVIVHSSKPSISQRFAASELAAYLHKISTATFSIKSEVPKSGKSIRFELQEGKEKEAYQIVIDQHGIKLVANSDRALLYAVYDFLGHLGCQWLAPDLQLYEGSSEMIPSISELVYTSQNDKIQTPAFAYRKIDVDGGRTHNANNLKKIVDWMSKVRYNTLRVPVNLNGNDRVKWDNWRDDLIPELKRRDLLLEVGGHGYQNFLNARMTNGNLFKDHPDWFAKDSACKPTPSERLVFNTSNPDAVNFFIHNVVEYIKNHPEINIFGLWPPDVGRWADCKEFDSLGSPADRQAAFTNQVAKAIQAIRPDIIVEIIAYSYTLLPPTKVPLQQNIQVDFCPINQSFEKQIYEKTSRNNSEYVEALKKWKQSFQGDVGLYSYYRKYAWRSAPNVIPRYIQNDMQWYAKMNIAGISTYAEPGDWFTYELNHYILAQTAWNPKVDINAFCDRYYQSRFGTLWLTAKSAYEALEKISTTYGSTPFTALKKESDIKNERIKIAKYAKVLDTERRRIKDKAAANNVSRLLLMLQYLQKDLAIQESRASSKKSEVIMDQIKDLLAFLESNLDRGVFILTGQNDLARFTKKYGLTNQSLLD